MVALYYVLEKVFGIEKTGWPITFFNMDFHVFLQAWEVFSNYFFKISALFSLSFLLETQLLECFPFWSNPIDHMGFFPHSFLLFSLPLL